MKTGRNDLEFDPGKYRLESLVLTLTMSQAAIEFECAIRGKDHFDFRAANMVRKTVRHFAGPDSPRRCPIATTLIACAFMNTESSEGFHADDLVAAALVLLDRREDPTGWNKLRDFCTALVRRFVEYRQGLPWHPGYPHLLCGNP